MTMNEIFLMLVCGWGMFIFGFFTASLMAVSKRAGKMTDEQRADAIEKEKWDQMLG